MKLHNSTPLKTIVFSILCLVFVNSATAQVQNKKEDEKSDFWKQVRFGGGLGVNTGNNIFSATLAPSAIYDFNQKASLGIGLNASYFSRKNVLKSTILGGSVIGLFNPMQEIQLSGEFEQNNVSRNFENENAEDDNYWIPSLLVGAGYRAKNITLGIRYDLLYDEAKSISANAWAPFVRVYF